MREYEELGDMESTEENEYDEVENVRYLLHQGRKKVGSTSSKL